MITNELLGYNARRNTTVTRRLVLPDILPEDLDQPRVHRRALRPNEVKETEVSLNS